VLKTSRMRWGKKRKDVDAGILKLLKRADGLILPRESR